jgi:hypothetical protein
MTTTSSTRVRLRQSIFARALVTVALTLELAGCGTSAPPPSKQPTKAAATTQPHSIARAGTVPSGTIQPPSAPWQVGDESKREPLRAIAMDGERKLGVIDHGALKVLWNLEKPQALVSLGKVDRAAFTPDGAWLATQRKLGEIRLWNVAEQSGPLTLPVRPEAHLIALLPGPIAVTQDAAKEAPSPVRKLDQSGRELQTFSCPPLLSVSPTATRAVANPKLGVFTVVELPGCRQLAAAPEGLTAALVAWNPSGTDAALLESVDLGEGPYVQRLLRWHDGRITLVRDFVSTPLAPEWGASFSAQDVVLSNDGKQIALTHLVHFDPRVCGMCRPQYYESSEELERDLGGPRGEHDYLIVDAGSGAQVDLGEGYVSETSEFSGDARFFRPRHTGHQQGLFGPGNYSTKEHPAATVSQSGVTRPFPTESTKSAAEASPP